MLFCLPYVDPITGMEYPDIMSDNSDGGGGTDATDSEYEELDSDESSDEEDDSDPVLNIRVAAMNQPSNDAIVQCGMCSHNRPTVTLLPCSHICMCNDCYTLSKIINCLKCEVVINGAVTGKTPSEDNLCVICYTRQVSVTFTPCGHTAV